MSFWRKNTGTEVSTIAQRTPVREPDNNPVKLTRIDNDAMQKHVSEMTTSELDQRIKELMRRDGPKMRNWSWELHAAIEEYRTRRQLREMDAKVKIAKGELELGELEVDRLHEKVDEDCLRMVRDGQLAYVPKRRR